MRNNLNKCTLVLALAAVVLAACAGLIIGLKRNPEKAKFILEKTGTIIYLMVFFALGWYFMQIGKKN